MKVTAAEVARWKQIESHAIALLDAIYFQAGKRRAATRLMRTLALPADKEALDAAAAGSPMVCPPSGLLDRVQGR